MIPNQTKYIISSHWLKDQFVKRIVTSGIFKYERKLEISKLEKALPLYKLHQPSGRSVRRLRKGQDKLV